VCSQRAIDQYLNKYAEPESGFTCVDGLLLHEACFVLPVYNESINELNRFLNLPGDKPILSVWVFNAPDNSSSSNLHETQKALQHFLSQYSFRKLNSSVFFARISQRHDMVVVDRCLEGSVIPAKQGVGLARKIGADVALRILRQTNNLLLGHRPYIHFCDADVVLPPDYFSPRTEAQKFPKPVAMLYPFEHAPQKGFELSCALYDFKLRYYTEQLLRAGSPYAYQALGSIIMLDPLAYAQVRGVPKRSGAEDFYLLNKLAKVGHILSLEGPLLSIEGRRSDRVPFGTGPAIDTISALENPQQDYLYYHPQIFLLLKHVLAVAASWNSSNFSINEFFGQLEVKCPIHIEVLRDVLISLKLEKFFRHCAQQNISPERFEESFHAWFDAFLTLRFIHMVRDQGYESVAIAQLESEGAMLSSPLFLAIEHVRDLTPK
jgi:hypothetical protein